MKVNEIAKLETLQQLNNVDLSNEIEGVYIGDLLSFVMANGKEGCLWLTVQKSINVIAVAELNDFAAIIFVQGSAPDEPTLNKANELGIPLFITKEDAYEMAKKLSEMGL